MRFLRRASSFLNNLRSSSDGSNLISSIGGFLSKISLLHVGLFAIPVLIILIIFLTLMSLFNYKINLMQMVDNGEAYSSSSSSLVAGDHMSIVEAAKTQLGQPYCYTGSVADPGGCGFDCSGLTWWAYEKAGYKIPHAQGYRSESFGFNGENSQAYWVHSKGHWKNNIDECNPGDLVFFSHSGTWKVTYHVGIYMGDHKMIHSGGSGVHISDYNSSGNFVGCGWPLEYDSYRSNLNANDFWEVNNGKYIFRYSDGKTKEWTVSEYVAWNKLNDQNVKAMDPKAGSRSGLSRGGWITYAGVRSYYRNDWDGPNQDAIKRGRSPYAITVDLDNFHESIFENRNGVWEPIKNAKVNHGGKFSSKTWKKLDHKLYAKNCKTPQGLFYTNGGRYPATNNGLRYWVSFGVKGGVNSSLKRQEYLFLHEVTGGKHVGSTNHGCITAKTEHAKWIYEHCGRGTPLLIW